MLKECPFHNLEIVMDDLLMVMLKSMIHIKKCFRNIKLRFGTKTCL